MPKFKIGDHVERVGGIIPEYMREGIIIRVIPDEHRHDLFNAYEVDFGHQVIAILYESQLRLATKANP
jgi:hypothetical protein